jgi:hypothetical protein
MIDTADLTTDLEKSLKDAVEEFRKTISENSTVYLKEWVIRHYGDKGPDFLKSLGIPTVHIDLKIKPTIYWDKEKNNNG